MALWRKNYFGRKICATKFDVKKCWCKKSFGVKMFFGGNVCWRRNVALKHFWRKKF